MQRAMDLEAKKVALRAIENGLFLVGCAAGQEKNVFLASWLSQCSFEPPLVMLGLKRGTTSHGLIKEGKGFVVNIPSAAQKDLVQRFFKHGEVRDGTIHGEPFTASRHIGAPILKATPAWFEAKVVHWFEKGDHDVVVAEVVDAGRNTSERFQALTETQTGWNYGG
jgi:flavin reductase (DIM6/NTAB) family NADH-FMN oxidoreductase RutF